MCLYEWQSDGRLFFLSLVFFAVFK